MAIGLNYTHINIGDRLILPNYIYLLPSKYRSDGVDDVEGIGTLITNGTLSLLLRESVNSGIFDDQIIGEILQEAYPYEIELKFLHHNVSDNTLRNQRLIALFNSFFRIDYHKELANYCGDCKRGELFHVDTEFSQSQVYQNIDHAIIKYSDFVEQLLRSEGFDKEAHALIQYLKTHLHISYEEGISGVTAEMGGEIYVAVGNSTYTTLYHELTHVVNRFFRYHYYHTGQVCFDNYTKTTEGFANFVAYHLLDAIGNNSLEALDELVLFPRYFSAYIDVYATLIEHGSNDRAHNYDLVYQEMSKYELGIFTDQKADFYYQRFYKFFHYDQHRYFYPKEMMYYLGYHDMLTLCKQSSDLPAFLTQCFLGSICL